MTREAVLARPISVRETILGTLREADCPLSIPELVKMSGIELPAVTLCLQRLTMIGEVQRLEYAGCKFTYWRLP